MLPVINTLKNKYSRTFNEMLFQLGFVGNIVHAKNGGAIICYHGVDLSSSKRYNMRFVSKKSLENQFRFMKKNFNILSVDDFFAQKFDPNKFNVAITFDDGYQNNFKYAFPLIEKYQIPCSFYLTGLNHTEYNFLWADMLDIVTVHSDVTELDICDIRFLKSGNSFVSEHGTVLKQFIKFGGDWDVKSKLIQKCKCFYDIVKQNSIDDYWKLMSDQEIVEVSKSPYITIGSHGFYHNNLGNIPHEKAVEEVLLSKNYLENVIQSTVDELAFPDGSYSTKLIPDLVEIGMTKQLALNYLDEQDANFPNLLNRHGIYPVYSDSYQMQEIPNLVGS